MKALTIRFAWFMLSTIFVAVVMTIPVALQ